MLYVGLGLVCVGLVITVVGLGDKGFQTLQGDNSYIYINNSYIHLINPILVCVGLVINVVGLGDKGFQTLQGDNSTVLGITMRILLENLPSV